MEMMAVPTRRRKRYQRAARAPSTALHPPPRPDLCCDASNTPTEPSPLISVSIGTESGVPRSGQSQEVAEAGWESFL